MIINQRNAAHEAAMIAAQQMMTAARTAPKAKGVDIIEVATIDGKDLINLAEWMEKYGTEHSRPSFIRDAGNVRQSQCVVLIGTHCQLMGLNCGHCGYATCEEKPESSPCAFNTIDVGIAVGSACATAADCRVDSRVLYSAGLAAQQMGLLPDCTQLLGIVVSISSKSPYFDRPAIK